MGSTEQPVIARAAEQPPELTGLVVVVDSQGLARPGGCATDGADSTLSLVDSVVVLAGHAVLRLNRLVMSTFPASLGILALTGRTKPRCPNGIRLPTL